MGASNRRRRVGVGRVLVFGLLLVMASGGQASAEPAPNLGGGTLAGGITFSSPGIPPANTPCAPVDFTFSLEGTAAIANGEGSFFAWAIGNPANDPQVFPSPPIRGSGHSDCENTTVGGGTLSIDDVHAENPFTGPGTLDCTAPPGKTKITGVYVRTLSDVTAVVGASCRINTSNLDPVAFVIRGQVSPTTPGAGLTTSITSATFVGGFVVVPAGEPVGLPGT